MKLWARYVAWFGGLQERERRIIALAVLLGGLFLGFSYAVEPNLLKARREGRAAADALASAATIGQQSALMAGANRDPDAPLRAELDKLKTEMASQGERFAAIEKSLVPPQQIPALLESVVGRNGALQLASLRTLPAQPVLQRKPGTEPARPASGAGPQAAAAAGAAAGAPNLYRHGVEIRLVGSYADLLGYVRALESAPQRLLWGRMELTTLDYPRSQLTLTVYTLSLDPKWLVL